MRNNQQGFAHIVIVILAVVVLGAVGFITYSKVSKPTVSTQNSPNASKTQQETNTPKEEKSTSDIDGGLKFVASKANVKYGIMELNGGLKAPSGNQFVTVEVQVTNTKSEKVPLTASDQVVTTSSDKQVYGERSLQNAITDGIWFEDIDAGKQEKGNFIFSIPKGDTIKSITLHATVGGSGATINLQ